MMSRPQALREFIARLASIQPADETLELVIAGDFVDFLAIEPSASFTPDPNQAKDKLARTMRAPPFDVVFTALGKLLHAGHELTVLVGNHDVELAIPQVQDALISHLSATPRALRFIDDGRAYRIGRALIEHGNRYDDANTNDWTRLRAMVSAFSRFETAPSAIEVSAGSRLVDIVINPIKQVYPFIDLVQPQNELVAMLLIAFEPRLLFHVDKLARLLHAKHLAEANKAGEQPAKTSAVSHRPTESLRDDVLADAFPEGVYDRLRKPSERVGAGDLVRIAWQARHDSLAEILARGDPVPRDRLHQMRLVMQRLLLDDDTDLFDANTGPYGKAAERIIASSNGAVEAVIMGHTHLARSRGPVDRATYINTGTWADIVRVPKSALTVGEDDSTADAELTEFLIDLLRDHRADISRPYAELGVTSDGAVIANELKWQPPEAIE
jgi:UDP-2,3-diacylglucosamine pyrophosphatase LpxH